MAKQARSDEFGHDFSHENRTEESRRLQEREAEIRQNFSMGVRDPLWVDETKIPYGWTYRYIRTSCMDIPDFQREQIAKQLGFTPVPSDRHPEKCTEPGSNQIKHRGLLLCEIPTSIQNERDKMQAIQNFQRVESLQGVNAMMSDPHLRGSAVDYGSRMSRTVSFAE